MEKTILHCDLNNFFASVECRDNPAFKEVPFAVCGIEEDRHGVILAKNELAKAFGVKTGEPIWKARQKCPSLKTAQPHMSKYIACSKEVRTLYSQYTDQVEPFGIDECWLDVSGSTGLFGDGKTIADTLRKEVREKMGLTISVGVSFNKIFAKLGSDLKKPDGTTVITKENFKEMVWPLPSNTLLGVGRATEEKLKKVGIYTIGDIACSQWNFLRYLLGKNGITLWNYANGFTTSPVAHEGFHRTAKSVGNSITCVKNLTQSFDVWKVILYLCDQISSRMRKENLLCQTIVLSVKDDQLQTYEYTAPLGAISRCTLLLAQKAMELFDSRYSGKPMRAIGIRAIELSGDDHLQTSIYPDMRRLHRLETLESRTDDLRERFPQLPLQRATLLLENYIPHSQPQNACLPQKQGYV